MRASAARVDELTQTNRDRCHVRSMPLDSGFKNTFLQPVRPSLHMPWLEAFDLPASNSP